MLCYLLPRPRPEPKQVHFMALSGDRPDYILLSTQN